MPKYKENIKILLIQSRLNKQLREQEHRHFLKFCRLNYEQIEMHYILENRIDINILKNYDALIIGGTGDFGVYEVKDKYPNAYKQLEDIMLYCLKNNIPTLNVCMQYTASILGGDVKTDNLHKEIGTFFIKLTPEGKNDILFKDMPHEFKTQMGHKDYVAKLPNGSTLLAYSELCHNNVYKIGENFYYFQFHPELDKDAIIERLIKHRDYLPYDQNDIDIWQKTLQETPESPSILLKFIEKVILK